MLIIKGYAVGIELIFIKRPPKPTDKQVYNSQYQQKVAHLVLRRDKMPLVLDSERHYVDLLQETGSDMADGIFSLKI